MNNLIKRYAQNLSKEDIISFAKKEDIQITSDEVNIIYDSIKNNIDILLSKDAISYLQRFKTLLSNEVYDKIIELYNKYKDFINL